MKRKSRQQGDSGANGDLFDGVISLIKVCVEQFFGGVLVFTSVTVEFPSSFDAAAESLPAFDDVVVIEMN